MVPTYLSLCRNIVIRRANINIRSVGNARLEGLLDDVDMSEYHPNGYHHRTRLTYQSTI